MSQSVPLRLAAFSVASNPVKPVFLVEVREAVTPRAAGLILAVLVVLAMVVDDVVELAVVVTVVVELAVVIELVVSDVVLLVVVVGTLLENLLDGGPVSCPGVSAFATSSPVESFDVK